MSLEIFDNTKFLCKTLLSFILISPPTILPNTIPFPSSPCFLFFLPFLFLFFLFLVPFFSSPSFSFSSSPSFLSHFTLFPLPSWEIGAVQLVFCVLWALFSGLFLNRSPPFKGPDKKCVNKYKISASISHLERDFHCK